MGRKSRRKGKRGERGACEALRDLFPNVRRTAMQARGGGEQPDLDNTPGWWIEVGVGNVNPRVKFEQALEDCGLDYYVGCAANPPTNTTPIALTKRDRGEWLVTMSLSDWKRLVREASAPKAARCPSAGPLWCYECNSVSCERSHG